MHVSRLSKAMHAERQAKIDLMRLQQALRGTVDATREDRSLLLHADGKPYTANEQVLLAEAMKVLQKAYPGSPARPHRWNLCIDGGALQIRHGMLGHEFPYLIPLHKIYSASQLDEKIRKGAGEFLERYLVDRARLAEVPDISTMRKTARGTPWMDKTDVRGAK